MEHVALSDQQLTYLARADPQLKPKFYGVVPCDGLPKSPVKDRPKGYIVNTDPRGQPGQHWMALWTQGNVCEVVDSYALPLDFYQQATPLKDWVMTHWKYVMSNGRSLQGIHSKACGHYALMYLKCRARDVNLQDFTNNFSTYDRVTNDHEVGQMIKALITEQDDRGWAKVCGCTPHQTCQSPQDQMITTT